MIGLAWRVLRRQPGTLLGAIVMTTIGAALITAFLVTYASIGSSRSPVQRYAGVPVVVGGPAGTFTPALVAELARLPGAAEVMPEVAFPVQVLTGAGAPVIGQAETAQFGHGWDSAALTPFEIMTGRAPAVEDDVAVDEALAHRAGLRVGDAVAIEAGGLAHQVRVSALLRAQHGLEHQHAVFFTPQRAAALADRGAGRVDTLGIVVARGADVAGVAAAADALLAEHFRQAPVGPSVGPSGAELYRVATGDDRGEMEGAIPDHRASAQTMYLLVWIVAFMAAVVIAGALVTSVRRRAGQFAMLRAIGATPGQVRLLCQAEALLVGALAVLVGLPAGALGAWLMVTLIRASGLLSPVLTMHTDPRTRGVAAAVVLLVSAAAAWFAARAALRSRPVDALGAPASSPRGRRRTLAQILAGVLSLAAAGGLQFAGMTGALPTALMGIYGTLAAALIIVGVALLGSWLVRLLAGWARPAVRRMAPFSGDLAAANVAFHHRRYAGVAVPMTVGLAMAGWALAGLPLYALSNAHETVDRFAADLVVSTPIVRDEHTGLAEQARLAVHRVDGVRATAGLRQGWIAALPQGVTATPSAFTWGLMVTGDAGHLLWLGRVDGDLAAVDRGSGVAIGMDYANSFGTALGDTVCLHLPGARSAFLPVVALFEQDQNAKQAVIVSQLVTEPMVGRRDYDYLLVAGGSAASIKPALAPAGPTVQERAALLASYVEDRRSVMHNLGTIGLSIVGLFLMAASVNALVLAHQDRMPELSALRRLSATPRQVLALSAAEMIATVVPACLLGLIAVAWLTVAMAGLDLAAAVWAYPALPLISASIVALLAAVGGTLVAVHRLQRRSARVR